MGLSAIPDKISGRLGHQFFVLTHKAQYNLANAETYFDEHLSVGEYYSEGSRVLGEWIGRAARRLNVSGIVGRDDFLKLCHNLNPSTDELLTQRHKTVRQESDRDGKSRSVANRRVFYDFTFSTPKSVSIVALVGGRKQIEEAHHRSVRAALALLETFAATRVRRAGENSHRLTGNILGAVFCHDASRALDPHLHTHCILFNATHDPVEDRWKALENYEMLAAQKCVENVYYHELARALKRLGYEIENRPQGDFEIKGVPKELCQKFSKRHQEIDDKTEQLLTSKSELAHGNVKDIRESIACTERSRKQKNMKRELLVMLWDSQISLEEKRLLTELQEQAPTKSIKQKLSEASAALSWAEDHLFDRNSVVLEHQLWRHALEHGRGRNFSLKELQRVTARRPYIRTETSHGKVTTREALEREWKIICRARDGRDRYEPLNAAYVIQNEKLDSEQHRAVEHILASRDFVTLFRGGAGTGKSFALKEVQAGLVRAGHQVLSIAPQRQQVIELQRKMLCHGQTVSEFLTKREMPEGAVVIVDEAGQIGAKQMQRLFDFVDERRGRLILCADTRQHGPVEASDALRAIEKYSGLKATELKIIRRQNPNVARTKEEREAIRQYKLAVIEARNGKLTQSFDRLNRKGFITQCGLFEQQELLTKHYFELAAKNCSTVIVSQTWAEIHRVNEQIRTGLKRKGLIGKEDTDVMSLQKVDLTDAQKRDKRFYSEKSVLVFNQDAAGFKKGGLGKAIHLNEDYLFVEADGRIRAISFKQLDRISVCEPKEMALAPGDRLQLKANARTNTREQLANGEVVTVKRIKDNGRIELEDGRVLESNYRQFVRGYAVTSYASQGKTADYVIFSDSAVKAATNRKQWYVTISRGRKGVKIFTTDKAQLRESVMRSGDRELALELAGTSPIQQTQFRWVDFLHRRLSSERRVKTATTEQARHRGQGI